MFWYFFHLSFYFYFSLIVSLSIIVAAAHIVCTVCVVLPFTLSLIHKNIAQKWMHIHSSIFIKFAHFYWSHCYSFSLFFSWYILTKSKIFFFFFGKTGNGEKTKPQKKQWTVAFANNRDQMAKAFAEASVIFSEVGPIDEKAVKKILIRYVQINQYISIWRVRLLHGINLV